MTDTSTSPTARPIAWSVFTVAVGVVACFGGKYAAMKLSGAIGLHGYLRDSGAAAWGDRLPLGLVAVLVVVVAKPRDWRQFGLLLALVVPLAFWSELAEGAAILAQHAIARQGSLFIMLAVFAILALPAFAPVWLKLGQAGMLTEEADGDGRGWLIGVGAAIAIMLPGLLAAALLIDLLRAFAWLPVDAEMAMAWTALPVLFAAMMAIRQARPGDPRQWAVLCDALAAAMLAAVLTGAGIAAGAGPLVDPGPRDFSLVLASVAAAFFIGWAARSAAHRLAGRDSPWRMAGRDLDDTA